MIIRNIVSGMDSGALFVNVTNESGDVRHTFASVEDAKTYLLRRGFKIWNESTQTYQRSETLRDRHFYDAAGGGYQRIIPYTFRDYFRAVADKYMGDSANKFHDFERFSEYCRDHGIIELTELSDGTVCNYDEAFTCDRCGDCVHSDDIHSVHDNANRPSSSDSVWCDNCTSNYATQDANDGEYYSNSAFSFYYSETDRGNICYEADPDYAIENCSELQSEDDDIEDEDDRDSEGLNSYHGSHRSWNTSAPKGDVYGVELECLANDSDDIPMIADRIRAAGFLAERDSSLDYARGAEIVGIPLTLAETQDENGAWCKLLADLRKHKVKSYKAGDGYGMHVSINRGDLSTIVAAKVVAFVNEQVTLGETIARRSQSSWAHFKHNRKRSDILLPRIYRRHGEKPNLRDSDKYDAAAVRGKRIEVRIFRGTLKRESFLRNVEYCAAVVAFCCVALLAELTAQNFCAFVASKRLVYPNLYAFLRTAGEIRPTRDERKASGKPCGETQKTLGDISYADRIAAAAVA